MISMQWIRMAAVMGVAGLSMFVVAGCDAKKGGPAKPAVAKDKHDDHDDHEGPHGGALVHWGDEEYHAEFTVDHKKQEARVYILGPDPKKYAPIKSAKVLLTIKSPTAFEVELKPEPAKDDPAGTSSVFVGKHEKLGTETEFAGEISTEINGKAYRNDFKEEAHDHAHDKKAKK